MALKTDYKDYIPPDEGVRWRIAANTDGSSSIEDITRYQQEGDRFTAGALNATNTAVNALCEGGVYATTLTPTGKTWLDAKPIWRRVIVRLPFPTVAQNNTTATAEYPLQGIGALVSVFGTDSTGTTLPRRMPDGEEVGLVLSPTKIVLTANRTALNGRTATLVLEYTQP